jgi:parvulin-like peptidyl-prolyl isomerase
MSDAGLSMPDGAEVPELGEVPPSVRFGAVLVQYAGAEDAKAKGPDGELRSKDEASKLADELAKLAREDFAEAVKKGDGGSTADAGVMFRGILEPAPEYVLFSLDKGAVSDPIDTPRGFWIVKRLE